MSYVISPEIGNKIDEWVLRYPPEQKRSGVFEALRLVQNDNQGSLTVDAMDAVANYLGMSKIAVYEVATFYSLYHLNPVGKHVIDVCTNISCSLNGSAEIVEHLKKRLGIDFNETTADGKFTLREVTCNNDGVKWQDQSPVMRETV
jgi:NADH-quinone oxidoreductase subunit E